MVASLNGLAALPPEGLEEERERGRRSAAIRKSSQKAPPLDVIPAAAGIQFTSINTHATYPC